MTCSSSPRAAFTRAANCSPESLVGGAGLFGQGPVDRNTLLDHVRTELVLLLRTIGDLAFDVGLGTLGLELGEILLQLGQAGLDL